MKAKIKLLFPKKVLFLLFSILLISLFFRFYNLENRYTFEWDQEDDAYKVMQIIENKRPRLIGPRVASDNGFFVGPFHYYFLLPFFLISKGNPMAGAYSAIFIDIVSIFFYYFVGAKLFNKKAGLYAALLLAIIPKLISWNVMYTPLLSVLIYYFSIKLIDFPKRYFFPLMFLLGFASTTHLVPASLIFPAFIAYLFTYKKFNRKDLFLGLFFFIIPFIPLILFDFRNHFLNISKVYEFIFSNGNKPDSQYFSLIFLKTFWRSLSVFKGINNLLVFNFISKIFILFIIIYGLFSYKSKNKNIITFTLVITPFLFLAFYKGNIPEYYYGTLLSLIPLFLGNFIANIKSPYLIAIFLLTIGYFQLTYIIKEKAVVSIKDKASVVNYITSQTQDPIFNVSFDLPIGWNTGYGYLFKYRGKPPVDADRGHLYTIVLLPSKENEKVIYQSGVIGVFRR